MHSPPPGSARRRSEPPEPPEPHEPLREPGLDDLVLAVARRLRRRWAEGLVPWGLSPHQGRALRVVTSYGELRLGDLADHLRIAPRSATEVVDGLVDQGLLERGPDPGDRRATLVRATAEGERVSAEVVAARTADADAIFGHLEASDRAELSRLLRLASDAPDPPAGR